MKMAGENEQMLGNMSPYVKLERMTQEPDARE